MINHKEQTSLQTKPDQGSANRAEDRDAQRNSLLTRSRELGEQAADLDTSFLAKQYVAALAAQVDSKQEQVSRIEDMLENLIEQQSSRLQQAMAQQPGLITLPGSRARWQQQIQQQQSTLQRLHGRLEQVREIKDGMGVHGNHIEELAARKLRFANPGVATEWDEHQAALRHRLAVQRKKPPGQRKPEKSMDGRGWSLSNRLNIDNPS